MNAPRKKWILGGLALALIVVVAVRYREHLPGISENDHESAHPHIKTAATWQPFDGNGYLSVCQLLSDRLRISHWKSSRLG